MGLKQAWNVGQLSDELGKYPFHSKYSGMYLLLCFAGKLRPVQFSSLTQSCLTLKPHEPQHARPPCPSPTTRVYPNPCPLSRWCHPTISSSVVPSSALNLSQHRGLFKWVTSSQQVAKGLEFQLQHQSFQWTPRTDWSPLGRTGWVSL